MEFTVITTKEVPVEWVEINVPVRDIPKDFPRRFGDVWNATVEFNTGRILGWPHQETESRLCMKVTDEGEYTLQDKDGNPIATCQNYVPHGVIPGEFGDYIDLQISKEGVITNWNPTCLDFFHQV